MTVSVVSIERREGRVSTAWLGVAVLIPQLWAVFHHSPWRDEVQALLISRQPFAEMCGSLHYEGHPALWYLLLKAVGLVTPLTWTLPVAQAFIAAGLQALIWAKSPFRWPATLAISVSYFVAFEYGVIARSYGIGTLLLFAFLTWRRHPWSWILLALMANVQALFAAVAGLCVIWQWTEGRRSWRGAALVAVGLALAVLTAWPAADAVKTMPLAPSLLGRLGILLDQASRSVWAGLTPSPELAVVGILPPLLGLAALSRRRRDALLFSAMCLALVALSLFVYPQMSWHAGVLAIWFIALLWGQAEAGIAPTTSAMLWLGLMALGGVWYVLGAAADPFSNARAIAEWSRKTHAAGPWAAYPGYNGLDVSGQTGAVTYNLDAQRWNAAPRWNYQRTDLSEAELSRRLDAFAAKVGTGYVISSEPNLPHAQPLVAFRGRAYPWPSYIYRVTAPR